MKVINKSIVTIIVLAISLCTCIDQPDKPNPCTGISETSADFDFIESYLGIELYGKDSIMKWYKNLDTLNARNTILLIAKDTTADYHLWQLNNSKVYTTTGVTFPFEIWGNVRGPVKIKHTVIKSKPIYTCFENDDSVKTFTRLTTFIAPDDLGYVGSWVGHYEGDEEETEVVIYKEYNSGYGDSSDLKISNFPKGCYKDDEINDDSGDDVSTKVFYIELRYPSTTDPFCKALGTNAGNDNLYGRLISKNTIELGTNKFKFRGTKKQKL